MPKALEEVTQEAMELSPRQRLALAEFLLESADAAADPDAETAWDSEIRDRICPQLPFSLAASKHGLMNQA